MADPPHPDHPGAARGHLGGARRAAAHPAVLAALAEGTVLSESVARLVCGWTDTLPAGCREAADGILVTAARAGGHREDLAAPAAEIYARSLPRTRTTPTRATSTADGPAAATSPPPRVRCTI